MRIECLAQGHYCHCQQIQTSDVMAGNNFPFQIWLANSVKRHVFQTRFCTLLWRKTATQKISCIAVISKMHSKLRCDTRKIIPVWLRVSGLIYWTITPFNNSLVRTRPALSRKILSLWMARAKLARAWPALFWCCFYQHQSSARPAPGADQRVSERSSARPRA